jgi:YD repeat-containing protein
MSDLAKWNLRGPVESLRAEFAEWDPDRDDWQPPRYSTLTRFHPDGRVAATEARNPDGSVSATTFAYDAHGRLVESQHQSGRSAYLYDDSGRLASVTSTGRDGVEHVTETWTYDAAGRGTKTCVIPDLAPNTGLAVSMDGTDLFYTASGAATVVTVRGVEGPSETRFCDAEGRVLRRVTFHRDPSGRLLREEIRLGEVGLVPELFEPGQVLTATTYDYDAAGRVVERRMQLADIAEHRTTWRYDAHDNRVEESNEENSRELQVDEQGNRTEVSQDSHRRDLRFVYRYDDRGNWTERVVSANSRPSNIERREIVYL